MMGIVGMMGMMGLVVMAMTMCIFFEQVGEMEMNVTCA